MAWLIEMKKPTPLQKHAVVPLLLTKTNTDSSLRSVSKDKNLKFWNLSGQSLPNKRKHYVKHETISD